MSRCFVTLSALRRGRTRPIPGVRDLLQPFHSDAKSRIEQHGGALEKFIGDAVMAVFGAPTAHGDDAERAVRAGLYVLEGIDELNREHGLGLTARAAVNTGEAVVALDSRPGIRLRPGMREHGVPTSDDGSSGRLLVGVDTYRATRDAI